MLTINRELVDAMIAHARRDHPDEACGCWPDRWAATPPALHPDGQRRPFHDVLRVRLR